ncbi:MAG: hypothetical protein PHO37_13755 [Kiritimatiellae bacterium]|nr:hypothetical protein [Kiritimatiellia bacterium]
MAEKAKTLRRSRRDSEMLVPSGLQMAGEALNIFGRLPAALHLLYYVGTLPFVIAFLYFWFDMSQSAYAQERLILWSLLLPVVFIWMKCWQSIYINALDNWLYEREPTQRSLRGVARLIALNLMVQPLGLIVLPLTMVFGLPFMSASFFFQNMLLSRADYQEGVLAGCASALRAARLHAGQGFMVIWLLSPWQLGMGFVVAYFMVFLNKYLGVEAATGGSSTLLLVGMASQAVLLACLVSPFGTLLGIGLTTLALSIPYLLEHVLGAETPFSHGWQAMLLNTSFVAVLYFLVFLILDPLLKIATVMRRFQYDARTGGDDILFSLKQLARRSRETARLVPIVFAVLALSPLASPAQGTQTKTAAASLSVEATRLQHGARLDAALDRTLQQPRYTWRMPRTLELDQTKKEPPGWLARWKAYIQSTQDKMARWLEDWLDRRDKNQDQGSWGLNISAAEGLFYLLLVIFGGVLTIMLLKWLRERRTLMAASAQVGTKLAINVHDHTVAPDDLPPDEWLELAAALVAAGDYRAALRALFLGVLAKLGEHDFITLRPYKSNYDYSRELELRARGQQELITTFRSLRTLMECTWYGYVPVTVELWRDYQAQSTNLRRACNPRAAQPRTIEEGGYD